MNHLADEGLASRSVLVGDVMADVCLSTAALVADRPVTLPDGVDPAAPDLVATVHRADNTDARDRLAAIADGLAALPVPVVLAAHPRLVARAASFGLALQRGAIRVAEPMAYPDMVAAVSASVGVITDSGGLQKEAYLLGVPCTTIRSETEWVETLAGGWNVLDYDLANLANAALRPPPAVERGYPYGRGDASEQAVAALLEHA
jgi:UDP-N-acetylglucosamine 2-epimerase (non-hydrolysing)